MQTVVPILITPPVTYPMSLAETRARLRIDTQDYDADLAALIAAATNMVEAYLNKALITRSYKGFLDRFPRRTHRGDWIGWGWNRLALPMPPLVSVDYLKTYDDSDAVTVFATSNYFVSGVGAWDEYGQIVLRDDASWPEVDRVANGVEIGWTCGLGAQLPPMQHEDIRAGIIATVGALFENRGDESAPAALPIVAQALLGPHRLYPV